MADLAVTGKKRSGKGLFCVGVMRDKIVAGCRVATNMNIYMEHLLDPMNKTTIIRLPDCPTVADLEFLGRGYEGDTIDEDCNGVIVLDESSKYFNSRTFGDKNRQPLLDYLIHSGKLRWDVYYQMQGLVQVDKQVRDTQVEYHVSVKRTDKWPIPFITPLCKLIGLNIRFPKMHIGVIRHGVERDSLVVDRRFYRASELYKAYDTEQKFLDRDHPDACGLHTVLSAYHIKGRYLPAAPCRFLRFVYAIVGHDWAAAKMANKPKHKSKHPLAVKLGKLNPDDAVRHWKRLDALGAFK